MYDRKDLFYLLILFASYLSISYGIWNTGVPFGDECGYIQEAMRLSKTGEYTSNLYLLAYELIFKFTQIDPASAHILLRALSSLVSVILIYFLFKVVNTRLNSLAVVLVCIFWMNCHVNIPLVQYGNINLFTFNIALAGIILLIKNQSLKIFLICIAAILLCARIRPEYWIAVILIPGYMLYAKRNAIFNLSTHNFISYLKMSKTGIVVLLLSIIFIFSWKDSSRNFDQYLLQGLSQCYTYLYAKMNPEMRINTMLEYSSLINEVFDKPTGFMDAVIKNPFEIVIYFSINGFINMVLLVPSLLLHRQIILHNFISSQFILFAILAIPIIQTILLLKRGIKTLGGISAILKIKVAEILSSLSRFISARLDITLLIILALVSGVSIPLLIPDPRYWISCIPLLILWLAWGFSRTFEGIKATRLLLAVIVIICLWLSRPMFLIRDDSRILLEMIRQHNDRLEIENPILAGHTSVGTYIFSSFIPMNINQMDFNSFINRKFDYFIVDRTIVESQFWDRNKEVLTKFVQSPETFGYSLLYKSRKRGEFIVAFGRIAAK